MVIDFAQIHKLPSFLNLIGERYREINHFLLYILFSAQKKSRFSRFISSGGNKKI